jgi:hypothetical protein
MRQGLRAGQGGRSHIALSGHLGELLQGRLGPRGPVALLTLPCPTFRLHGFWRPGAFALHQPSRPVLTRAQAAGLLHALHLPLSGQFTLRADMPLGGGAGSSTAALVAVARLAGHPADKAGELALATIAIEGASDPLMFSNPAGLLWASRLGRILSLLPPLPPIEVLGGFYGPVSRTDPMDDTFPDISDLAAALPTALKRAASLADLARESARRSLASRSYGADPTDMLATELGALGYAIGHTGPARALIFTPGTIPANAKAALLEAGFRQLAHFRPGS